MDIQVTRFVRSDGDGALQAFCDITIGDAILVKGVRVVEGRIGAFVTMPRQQSATGKWYDSVVFLDAALKANVTRVVMEAYRASEQTANRAHVHGS